MQCGASFDVKYCRRLHPNPATADYCRVCGSSDLSLPDRRPRSSRAGLIALVVIGTSLAGVSLLLAAPFAYVVLQSREGLGALASLILIFLVVVRLGFR